ncbi:hypothetical protein CN338_07385 [Bacillus cereus]|nr:hypothetical protein CN338_07385 [Bacillus cereus]
MKNRLKGKEIQYEPFTKKKMLQRVEEEETSYCNDDPLAIAKGIRNGFLMVMPFWLVVSYLVI